MYDCELPDEEVKPRVIPMFAKKASASSPAGKTAAIDPVIDAETLVDSVYVTESVTEVRLL